MSINRAIWPNPSQWNDKDWSGTAKRVDWSHSCRAGSMTAGRQSWTDLRLVFVERPLDVPVTSVLAGLAPPSRSSAGGARTTMRMPQMEKSNSRGQKG